MKKIKYCFKRLGAEYKAMHKPDGKTLMKDTVRIMGSAAAAKRSRGHVKGKGEDTLR